MDTYRGPNPLGKRMSITDSKSFKKAIDLAIAGNKNIVMDIANYVTYNYYMCLHIKEGSDDDLQNEKLYTELKENYPELYYVVEGWVNYKFNRIKRLAEDSEYDG